AISAAPIYLGVPILQVSASPQLQSAGSAPGGDPELYVDDSNGDLTAHGSLATADVTVPDNQATDARGLLAAVRPVVEFPVGSRSGVPVPSDDPVPDQLFAFLETEWSQEGVATYLQGELPNPAARDAVFAGVSAGWLPNPDGTPPGARSSQILAVHSSRQTDDPLLDLALFSD